MRPFDHLTGGIIESAIEIHRALGPGLLESAYEELLAGELHRRGFALRRQAMIPFSWKDQRVQFGFRVDLLVNERVLVEIKATDRPNPVFARQVLTYLRLMQLPVGLLIIFGTYRLVDGIQRVTNHDAPYVAPPDVVWPTRHKGETDCWRIREKEGPVRKHGAPPAPRGSPFLRFSDSLHVSSASPRSCAGA